MSKRNVQSKYYNMNGVISNVYGSSAKIILSDFRSRYGTNVWKWYHIYHDLIRCLWYTKESKDKCKVS